MKISGVGFLGLPIELSQFGKARGNQHMLCAERLFPYGQSALQAILVVFLFLLYLVQDTQTVENTCRA